jgi:hypothetical protein
MSGWSASSEGSLPAFDNQIKMRMKENFIENVCVLGEGGWLLGVLCLKRTDYFST